MHEAFAAQFATVRPLTAGHAFVVLQSPRVAESLAACGALEWLVLVAAGSGAHVFLQVLSGVKASTALRAKMQEVPTLPTRLLFQATGG